MLSWDGAAPAVVSAGRRPPPADGAPAGPPTPTPSQRTSHALIAQEVLACLPPAGSYPPQVLATALGVAELRLKSLKVWEDVTVEATVADGKAAVHVDVTEARWFNLHAHAYTTDKSLLQVEFGGGLASPLSQHETFSVKYSKPDLAPTDLTRPLTGEKETATKSPAQVAADAARGTMWQGAATDLLQSKGVRAAASAPRAFGWPVDVSVAAVADDVDSRRSPLGYVERALKLEAVLRPLRAWPHPVLSPHELTATVSDRRVRDEPGLVVGGPGSAGPRHAGQASRAAALWWRTQGDRRDDSAAPTAGAAHAAALGVTVPLDAPAAAHVAAKGAAQRHWRLFDVPWAVPRDRPAAFSVSAEARALFPLLSQSRATGPAAYVGDRYFLGGPAPLRGFGPCGASPKDAAGAPLPADATWRALAMLSAPMPLPFLADPPGGLLRVHGLATAGNAAQLWPRPAGGGAGLAALAAAPAAAVGLGVSASAGGFRAEVNATADPRDLFAAQGQRWRFGFMASFE